VPWTDHLLALFLARAAWLAPLLFLAFLLGEYPARFTGLDALLTRMQSWLAALTRKLNRRQRGTAALVYRGMVVLVLAVIPAVALGWLLARPMPWMQLLAMLIVAALYGRAFATFRLLRLWHRARRGTLPLELPGGDFLFPDTHAVLRYTIATSARAFATGIVGASFWFVLGGMPLMFAYLAIAALHAQLRSPAFGWAAHALFRLLDAIPSMLSTLLLTLAALFTPRTRPLAARRARSREGVVAHLLDLSLGGPMPEGNAPWVGTGTPKLNEAHLLRWILLRLVASFLLLLCLIAPNASNIMKILHYHG
jgi:adenosylcobinamide-phosphate synthase